MSNKELFDSTAEGGSGIAHFADLFLLERAIAISNFLHRVLKVVPACGISLFDEVVDRIEECFCRSFLPKLLHLFENQTNRIEMESFRRFPGRKGRF